MLQLRCRGRDVVLDGRRTVTVVGRKRVCDLRVDEPLASRQHVRLKRRSDRGVIGDQSTSATDL